MSLLSHINLYNTYINELRHAYNISDIQRRIQYLEERITDMDDELRRQKE